MAWSPNSRELREAASHLLLAPELQNILCSYDHLRGPLDVLGGGLGRDEYADITKHMITAAFSQTGGAQEYIIAYDDFLEFEGRGDSDLEHFLLARVDLRKGKEKVYELARITRERGGSDPLTLEDELVPAAQSTKSMFPHPLDSHKLVKSLKDVVPHAVQQGLADFLRRRKAEQNKRGKGKKGKGRAKKAAIRSITPVPPPPPPSPPPSPAPSTLASPAASSSPSPRSSPDAKKARKGTRDKIDPSDVEIAAQLVRLESHCRDLKTQIMQLASELSSSERQMKDIKEKRCRIRGKAHVSSSSISLPVGTTVGFHALGRVGQCNIDNSGVIFVSDLEHALLQPPNGRGNDESERARRRRRVNETIQKR